MSDDLPSKKLVMLLMTIGGVVGGYLPVLFGDSGFSMLPIITSTIGGGIGIWLAFRLSR